MRVLFDQCTPEALRKELPGHDIQTANEAGVSDLENGDLIDEAVRRGYDLLVTADRRMQKQEEIKGKPLRVVVLTRPDWSKVEKQKASHDQRHDCGPRRSRRWQCGR